MGRQDLGAQGFGHLIRRYSNRATFSDRATFLFCASKATQNPGKYGCSAGCASPGHIKIAQLEEFFTHATTVTLNDHISFLSFLLLMEWVSGSRQNCFREPAELLGGGGCCLFTYESF